VVTLIAITIIVVSAQNSDSSSGDAEPIVAVVAEQPVEVKPSLSEARAALPRYEILQDEPSEMVGKAQVALSVLLKDKPQESQLRALLNDLFRQSMKRTGFRFRKHPTAVYIYIYESPNHYQSGGWLAMLSYNENVGDRTPNIDVCDEALRALHRPQVRFGLTEEQRREIFWEIVVLEDKARKEAETLYPEPELGPSFSKVLFRDAIEKQQQHAASLREQYEEILRRQYRLTKEEVDDIGIEGVTKHWPMPRSP